MGRPKKSANVATKVVKGKSKAKGKRKEPEDNSGSESESDIITLGANDRCQCINKNKPIYGSHMVFCENECGLYFHSKCYPDLDDYTKLKKEWGKARYGKTEWYCLPCKKKMTWQCSNPDCSRAGNELPYLAFDEKQLWARITNQNKQVCKTCITKNQKKEELKKEETKEEQEEEEKKEVIKEEETKEEIPEQAKKKQKVEIDPKEYYMDKVYDPEGKNEFPLDKELKELYCDNTGRYDEIAVCVVHDGNSLYRCLAKSLDGDESKHYSRRQQFCDFVEKEWDSLTPEHKALISLDYEKLNKQAPTDPLQKRDEWLAIQRLFGSTMNPQTIRVMAECFKLRIHVRYMEEVNRFPMRFPWEMEWDERCKGWPLFPLYMTEYKYFSLEETLSEKNKDYNSNYKNHWTEEDTIQAKKDGYLN